jgi:outer membrane protein W
MLAATLWLVTASLAASPQAQDPRSVPTQTTRPHTIGLGASIGVSNRGAGGAFRYWFGDTVGLDFQAAFYRGYSRATSQGNVSSGNTFQMLPSFLLNLKKPDPNADIDVRPYVGGGVNYLQTSRPTAPLASLDQRTSGVGGQVFGGVEMTFKDAPNMTISAEGIYYKLPMRTVNAQLIDGFNYLVAFHYYLK